MGGIYRNAGPILVKRPKLPASTGRVDYADLPLGPGYCKARSSAWRTGEVSKRIRPNEQHAVVSLHPSSVGVANRAAGPTARSAAS